MLSRSFIWRSRSAAGRAARLLTCTLLLALSGVSPASTQLRLDVFVPALERQLPAQARDALRRIEGTPRQLLAMRAYLRAGESLQHRWSWSAERIAAFTRTADHRELLAEIDRIEARFASQNPGYQLYANTEVRSLDQQLQRWNSNAAVAAVAESLQRDVLREIELRSLAADASGVRQLTQFLKSWRPRRAPPLAAPGLSLHGQLRAIDFHIMKGDAIVAGTEVAAVKRVWEKQGWSEKLRLAVAGSRFRGPLQSPNEPWHYEYVP